MRHLAALVTAVFWVSACNGSPSLPTKCSYGLSPASLDVPSSGGTSTVTVSTAAGCTWSARADASWITIAAGAAGSGGGTVTLSIAPNTSGDARSGTLVVADQTVVVRQAAQACAFVLFPDGRQFEAAGGSGTIGVTAPAHCAWTAVSSVPWVVITSGADGRGSGQVAYGVGPNNDPAARTATIDVADQQFVVTQSGRTACTVSLSPDDETIQAAAGVGSFTVLAPAGCAWIAASQASWIRVTSPADGGGAGTRSVTYSVEANPNAGARTGIISVGEAAFVLTQLGTRDCSYGVDPVALTLCMYDSNLDMPIHLMTQTGCPWTATSAETWITITSAPAGSGPATIVFRVTDNSGPRREGVIQIRWPTPTAGQNVTVTQAGCLYSVNPSTIAVAAAGGTASFDVWQFADPNTCGGPLQDRCRWTAVASASWITITASPSQGDGTVRFTVGPNTTGSARTATITVADKVVTVQQAGV